MNFVIKRPMHMGGGGKRVSVISRPVQVTANSGQQGYMVRTCHNNNNNSNDNNSTHPQIGKKKHNHRLKKNTTKNPSSLYSKPYSSPRNEEDSDLYF